MPFVLPRNLVEAADSEVRQAWMAALPSMVEAVRERWSPELGEPFQPAVRRPGLAPARRGGDGAELVLKLAWRHPEAEHEADGLLVWDGNGVVRVHAVEQFADTSALLIEKCVPGTSLATRPESEQDVVIAGLLRRLWLTPPPGHRFRSLQVMCDAWADAFEQRSSVARVGRDPGLARTGIALFRSLPATADREVLLCTDLHAGNVLAARREPWLVIDPKPYVGDPTYDALQHLLNCEERLRADPTGLWRASPICSGLIASGSNSGCSPAALKSHPTGPR